MNDEDFQKLVLSVEQMGTIMQGENSMKPLRRMPSEDAAAEATRLASEFLSSTDTKAFTGKLEHAAPDPIATEMVGKVPRYWVSLVSWTREGAEIDGPQSFGST